MKKEKIDDVELVEDTDEAIEEIEKAMGIDYDKVKKVSDKVFEK